MKRANSKPANSCNSELTTSSLPNDAWQDGWINFNKEYGISSTKASAQIRKLLAINKLGHCGTLDPLASGVLPLAFGRATKSIDFLLQADKQYHVDIRFGVQTSTDDAEGDVIATSDRLPVLDEITECLSHFQGVITQIPPQFSAVMIGGRRAYSIARTDQPVNLQPRKVRVNRINIIAVRHQGTVPVTPAISTKHIPVQQLTLALECGKGFYVRSLARDLGLALGCYGYVARLIRTAVGSFSINHALTYSQLSSMVAATGNASSAIKSVDSVLSNIPIVTVNEKQLWMLCTGQKLLTSKLNLAQQQSDTASPKQTAYKSVWGENSEQSKATPLATYLRIYHQGVFFCTATAHAGRVKLHRLFRNYLIPRKEEIGITKYN